MNERHKQDDVLGSLKARCLRQFISFNAIDFSVLSALDPPPTFFFFITFLGKPFSAFEGFRSGERNLQIAMVMSLCT